MRARSPIGAVWRVPAQPEVDQHPGKGDVIGLGIQKKRLFAGRELRFGVGRHRHIEAHSHAAFTAAASGGPAVCQVCRRARAPGRARAQFVRPTNQMFRRTLRYPPAVSAVDVEIHRDVGKLDELEPLYAALLAHHANLPDVPLAQPEERSWWLRRAEYETWLRHDDGFVVVARRDGVAVGYAVVSIAAGPDDMWVTGNRIAEVQTLCVRAADRSTGIGTTLLDAIDSTLASQGVHDLQVAVVATNADAIRLYQRRGLSPRLMVLSNYAQVSGDRCQPRSPTLTSPERMAHRPL